LYDDNFKIVEAKLNALLGAVRESGMAKDIERELIRGVDDIHYNQFKNKYE